MPLRPSYTIMALCFIACISVMDTNSFKLAFIHEEELDLNRPNSLIELWLSAVLQDASHINCPSHPIELTRFQISSGAISIWKEQITARTNEFDGWILASSSDCQLADQVEMILTSVTTPFLRLDLIACPLFAAGLKTERLEIYRLNDINRYLCGSFSLNLWLVQRICSSSFDDQTRHLLLENQVLFDVNRKLQDCTGLDDNQWSQSNYPSVKFDAIIKNINWLSGKKLRFTSLERFLGNKPSPYVTVVRGANGTIIGYKGYCYEIIHALQKLYNFTYEVEIPSDNMYGTETSNGSWDGMIRLILEQRVDIAVGVFSVTHSRSQVVDFSVGFLEEPATILIPPPAEESRLLVCTKPFQFKVWLALILYALIIPAILWQQCKYLWILYRGRYPSLLKHFSFVFGVLIGQSGQRLSSPGFSPRLIGAVWCLSAVVFTSAYVGILMTFLRFPKLLPIISKLEELPRSNLKWTVVRGTALESLFVEAETGIYKAIGDGLLANPKTLVDSGVEGILRVTNQSYAYIEEKSYLEAIVEQDHVHTGICRFSLVNQEFFKVNFAFALPKTSPLKPILDRKILEMKEAGLGNYWKKVYWPPLCGRCGSVKRSDGPKSLKLVDLNGAFLVLIFGSGLSLILFIAEIVSFLSRFLFLTHASFD